MRARSVLLRQTSPSPPPPSPTLYLTFFLFCISRKNLLYFYTYSMLCIICYARLVSLSFQEIDGQWLRPGSEDIALTRLFTVSVEFYFPENIIPRGSIYAHINKHSPTEHFEIYPRVKKKKRLRKCVYI